MYVGKIKVSHKRVPHTFIDDALPKFKAYDAQKIKMQAELQRRVSCYLLSCPCHVLAPRVSPNAHFSLCQATSNNGTDSDSQENLTTSQRIGDDFRLTAQSIHEADESKEDGNDEKTTNNDDGEAIKSCDNDASEQSNRNDEPVPKVQRSQSTYTMPVTNG